MIAGISMRLFWIRPFYLCRIWVEWSLLCRWAPVRICWIKRTTMVLATNATGADWQHDCMLKKKLLMCAILCHGQNMSKHGLFSWKVGWMTVNSMFAHNHGNQLMSLKDIQILGKETTERYCKYLLLYIAFQNNLCLRSRFLRSLVSLKLQLLKCTKLADSWQTPYSDPTATLSRLLSLSRSFVSCFRLWRCGNLDLP